MSLDSTGFGFNNNSLTSITSAIKFSGLKALFDVGGAPLTITYGVKPAFKFSNFAFNSGGRGDGFVASLDGSSVLPLSPTLTVVYGSQLEIPLWYRSSRLHGYKHHNGHFHSCAETSRI